MAPRYGAARFGSERVRRYAPTCLDVPLARHTGGKPVSVRDGVGHSVTGRVCDGKSRAKRDAITFADPGVAVASAHIFS